MKNSYETKLLLDSLGFTTGGKELLNFSHGSILLSLNTTYIQKAVPADPPPRCCFALGSSMECWPLVRSGCLDGTLPFLFVRKHVLQRLSVFAQLFGAFYDVGSLSNFCLRPWPSSCDARPTIVLLKD